MKQKRGYSNLLRVFSGLQIVFLFAIASILFFESRKALNEFGWSFFFKSIWDPVNENYGALLFICGTLSTSLLALLIALPLSLGSAIFITQYVPKKLGSTLAFLVDLLAAVPSIIYGLWGVFVLIPLLRNLLGDSLRNLFEFNFYGVGIFTSAVVLAIMIIPTITSLSRELFKAAPRVYRESALALGATRWEAIHFGVLGVSWKGIAGSALLGLGRALGETMAVTMVIGNANRFPSGDGGLVRYLFDPSNTMASLVANEYAEAQIGSVHLSSLFLVGLGLLVVSLLTNFVARNIVSERKVRKQARKRYRK